MTGSTPGPKKPRGPHKHGQLPHVRANDKFNNYKVCNECGETKRLADFALTGNWKKKRAADPKRYKTKCKQCSRHPNAVDVDPGFKPVRVRKPRARKLTPEESRAARAANKRKVRRDTRIRALEYLAEKGCSDCGERDPRVLEFDHIDPGEKEHDVAQLFSNGYGWGSERLRAEIRKCRVICANCHRKHTIVQQEYYAHEEVKSALRGIFERYDIDDQN